MEDVKPGEFIAVVELVAKYGDLGVNNIVREATDYFVQNLFEDSLTLRSESVTPVTHIRP